MRIMRRIGRILYTFAAAGLLMTGLSSCGAAAAAGGAGEAQAAQGKAQLEATEEQEAAVKAAEEAAKKAAEEAAKNAAQTQAPATTPVTQ